MNSLPKAVTRQCRDYDLNSGPSAPESSTLTTRLPSHPVVYTKSQAPITGNSVVDHYLPQSRAYDKPRVVTACKNSHCVRVPRTSADKRIVLRHSEGPP